MCEKLPRLSQKQLMKEQKCAHMSKKVGGFLWIN